MAKREESPKKVSAKLDPDNVEITPQNIVASVHFHVELPLEKVSKKLGAEFNPDTFPGAIYRKEAGYTFLLFKNGKAVLAGVSSYKQLLKAVKGLREEFKKTLKIKTKKPDIDIQNMVFSLDVGAEVNLEEFVREVYDSYYSPELFPGLTYKIYDPAATFLVFSSGKCVLAGLKDIRDLEKAIGKLVSTLNQSGALRDYTREPGDVKRPVSEAKKALEKRPDK